MINEMRFAGNGPIIAFGAKNDAAMPPAGGCVGGANARKSGQARQQCLPMAAYPEQPGQKFDRFA